VLGFIIWRRDREEVILTPPAAVIPDNTEKFYFGKFVLDMTNLVLVGQSHSRLTYREAKLLKLFATNTNRILERDYILRVVWEDEGIFVGRSVDVFVSRLRKMLAEDPGLKIAAVHGVGYRMEVTS
jgi:DNA-binding response OmpR family regulator